MWVVVTVLIVLWRVVTEVDWVFTDLNSGGDGYKSSNNLELHIYNFQNQL